MSGRCFRLVSRVLRDARNGDEQVHDRGDGSGPSRHADNQARSGRPVTGFVPLLLARCATERLVGAEWGPVGA
jgi:hypothetical protein